MNTKLLFKPMFVGLALLYIGSFKSQAQTIPQWQFVNSSTISNLNSGNVGIGTDNPQEKLHINGNIRGAAGGGAIRIKTASGYIDVGSMNSSFAHIYTDRSKFIFNKSIFITGGKLSSYSTSNLTLQTNNSDKLTILNSNGNVGIGLTNPAQKLEVNGGVQFRGNLFMYDKDILNIRSIQLKDYDDNSGGQNSKYRILARDGSFQFFNGGVVVGSYPNGTWSDLPDGSLRVETDLGISVTNPTEKLDVNGTARLRGLTQNEAANRILAADTNGKVFWKTSAEGAIEGISSLNGNIGINVTNPIWPLDVQGHARIGNGGNDDVYLGEGGVYHGDVGDVPLAKYDQATGNISYGDNDALIIRNNGNIGIGTTNPTNKLHVLGSGYFSGGVTTNFVSVDQLYISDLYFTEDALGYGYDEIGITTEDEAMMAVMINDGGQGHFKFGATYDGQYQDGITILNGNIGINNDSPNHSLSVGGTVNANNYLINGQPFTGGSIDGITSLNGKVGINTTTPQETLHVTGKIRSQTANEDFYIEIGGVLGAPENQGIFHSHGGNIINGDYQGNVFIGNTNAWSRIQGKLGINKIPGSYALDVNGEVNATSFLINGQPISAGIDNLISLSGNILINKTTQTNTSYKLDVNGPIRANEVVVNTTGADFVFEEDYKLRSLDEVASFIYENNHLPDIPPAADMQNNGMSVGELNTKLLQKVEELTLYLIEMKKENEELKSRVETLENN